MNITGMIRKCFRKFNIDVVRYSSNQKLVDEAHKLRPRVALLAVLPDEALRPAISALPESKSQLCQDIFALATSGFKRGGFFVEFGATDGLNLSNTWLLEKRFGWSGILAEPARTWHAALARNRSAAIEHDCVWSRSGDMLTFSEVQGRSELSTISSLADKDPLASWRHGARQYQVKTIAFNELLERHGAPARMDFLSIDTEGSEYEILASLDWSRWKFDLIVCEHNFTPNRERIHDLLAGVGYERVHVDVSEFDDWYILRG
jgi:FkbM family methyltransferase